VLASHKCHGWQLHLRAAGPCYHDDLSVHAVVAARLGGCVFVREADVHGQRWAGAQPAGARQMAAEILNG